MRTGLAVYDVVIVHKPQILQARSPAGSALTTGAPLTTSAATAPPSPKKSGPSESPKNDQWKQYVVPSPQSPKGKLYNIESLKGINLYKNLWVSVDGGLGSFEIYSLVKF